MLKVLKPGFYSTIQDIGRSGYREYGVPISGAMDSYSSRLANALLGNYKNAAFIEMTMVGGTFQFLEPTVIAITGAFMCPKLNGTAIGQNRLVKIKSKDILSFHRAEDGFRAYLAIKDGFQSDLELGSRSQYKPVTLNNTIKEGELIPYRTFTNFKGSNSKVKYDDSVLKSTLLDVLKGPEFNRLTQRQKELLERGVFKVTKYNNRMAYQLEPTIKNNLNTVLSSPVLPGTVQLTPSGNLIVLMRDCQTTGGYPRILQLTEEAINKLSQKTSVKPLEFRLIE